MNPMLWRVAACSGPGFPSPAINRICGLVSSTSRQSAICNPQLRRLFLLLLFWSFFLRRRSRSSSSSSFALFLFLGDHFWSGNRSFCLRRNPFFFHYRRDHGKRCEILLHLCCYSGRKLNVANVNGIANV